MKVNLSLFLFLSFLTSIFFHRKGEESSLEALFSLILSFALLSVVFILLRKFLTIANQKIFMLGYSGMILWIAGVIGGEMLYLYSKTISKVYFYSLIVISKKERLIFFLATLFGLAILLYQNSQFINKIDLGIQEFSNYKMNGLNADSSIEMRLSMYRMGAEYFFERPFAGWGDLSWRDSTIWREFTIFASSMAINAPKHGFHNEIITNSVRSGIWGFISVVSLYIVVAYSAASGLKMKLDRLHRLVSVSMLVVILHLFFAGLVTETTNLTFLSTFIGVLLAVLCGEQQFLEANSGN